MNSAKATNETTAGHAGSASSESRVLRVVALASRTGRYGGPFDTASRQVQILRASRIEARLLSGYTSDDRPSDTELAPGRYIKVHKLLPTRGFTSIFSLRMAIVAILEIHNSQVVHISFAREPIPIWSAIVALLLKRRVVLQPHGMLTARSTRAHRAFDRIVTRPIVSKASEVIALSSIEDHQLQHWHGHPLRTTIIGNPVPRKAVDLSRVRSNPTEADVRITFIARLHPRKRVADFLKAASIAQLNGREWEWVVVGPDEGDAGLVKTEASKNPYLRYLGAVSAEEVVNELNRSTIFAMTSENEPWGNVLASAIAMGLPVVVTRSAALAAPIQRYGAGRVIEDHDAPGLFEAVSDLLSLDHYTTASLGSRRMKQDLLDPEILQARLITAVTRASTLGL